MDMKNLRERFGAVLVAGAMGVVMIASSAPMYAAGLNSPGADACAFVAGIAMKVPGGVPGMLVLLEVVQTLFGC
jgi:hypothetical protein